MTKGTDDERFKGLNEKGIRKALAKRLPSIGQLFLDEHIAHLADAWEAGRSRAFHHPLIDILLGDDFREHARVLDAGLMTMLTQGADLEPHLHRLTLPSTRTSAFSQALGAANELFVAASAACAGGTVSFVPTSVNATPDIDVTVDEQTLTLEVTTWGLPAEQVASGNRANYAFTNWKPGRPVPKDLRGHASDRGGVRTMSRGVALLEGANIAERVRALSGKKGSSQLRGRSNGILVISARHQWGVSASDCHPRVTARKAHFSGVCYAATYGQKSDYLYEGEEFDGRGHTVFPQLNDGILRGPSSAAAVLFLFNKGRHVAMENLQQSSGLSSTSTRRFLGKAFDLDKGATIFKARC